MTSKMGVYFLNIRITLSILLVVVSSCMGMKKGCMFRHQGCSYHIHLNHNGASKELTGVTNNECGKRVVENIDLDRFQNDYTAKISVIEKNFSFLRDAHEQRIKDLESTINELIGTSKDRLRSAKQTRASGANGINVQGGLNQELMNRLEVEFENLRNDIRQKSDELLETKFKLNETSVLMHNAQLKHFETSKDLIDMENQLTVLRRERAILKNQLKDRSYKLQVSDSKAQDCELKSTDQQNKMMELFRSEATLKEELMTTQMTLNITLKKQQEADVKHQKLKSQHSRVRSILKRRERELLHCYSAKTSTFCGFEDPDMCGFTNINDTSDFFDWTRGEGKTPSARTGPSKDHTCDGLKGHFMYIEASAKGRGSNAILYSPLYRGMKEQCAEFFYHMNGRHIGTLNVYAQARGDVLNSAWRAYGNQGDVWTSARLAIPKELAMAGYQLAFEGITENGYQGDMAIDDVSVRDGPCPSDVAVVPVTVNVNSSVIIKSGKKFARKMRKKRKKFNKKN